MFIIKTLVGTKTLKTKSIIIIIVIKYAEGILL